MPDSARSPRSRRPCLSARPGSSRASFASVISAGSAFSVISIGSAGSILSIGSAGSILSIGSAGSILSIGSAGSILSIGSAWSVQGHHRRRIDGHRVGRVMAWAGLVAALVAR